VASLCLCRGNFSDDSAVTESSVGDRSGRVIAVVPFFRFRTRSVGGEVARLVSAARLVRSGASVCRVTSSRRRWPGASTVAK
jgi:hypothetical protein